MITVENLSFSYRGGSPAIEGLSFAVATGEIFGFLGPSGAGKSTTQKILMRLLKGYSGRVEIMGRSLGEWGQDYFEHVGVSFEQPANYRKLTCRENLRFFAGLFRSHTDDPDELLELVALGEAADKRVEQLSKGMQIRLNFARALLQRPALLFLDEPTAGLDPVNARRIKQIIVERRAQGCTVFLTTHDMKIADDLCDRVGFLVDGSLRRVGAPAALRLEHGNRVVRVGTGTRTGTGTDAAVEHTDFPLDGLGDDPRFLELIRTRRIETMHTQEPSLEDVFIAVTGKELT